MTNPTPIALSDKALLEQDVEAYLTRYQNKELLRFVVVGSVDDGKSTLIGRLLHDTGMVYEDQVQAVKRATQMEGQEIDFSLFTDGLKAEREQGITIDVAYRYFSTEKRKFILADTPGHIQYTRNMVTGASTADVALILIDARLGVLEQSVRHAFLAALLGIPHLAVCINKMDLVGYDPEVFERIQANFKKVTEGLAFRETQFFPVSALQGANIVGPSSDTDWYAGPSVLQYLETTHPWVPEQAGSPFRLPVQTVVRPNLNYRGFAGTIASGSITAGDRLTVLPSGKGSTVAGVDLAGTEIPRGIKGQSVVIRLSDEVDVSRGDMLVPPDAMPQVMRKFEANVVWMNERPLDLQKTYLLKHTTQLIRTQVDAVVDRVDLTAMLDQGSPSVDSTTPHDGPLGLNEIARLRISTHRALYFDAYQDNRTTGSFILIDSLSNNTVAAGMIELPGRPSQSLEEVRRELQAGSGLAPKTQVSPLERRERMGQEGRTVWLTGLPGSGRWSLAYALERRLFDLGRTATVVVPAQHNLASMVAAARACTDAGLVTICAYPSFQRAEREQVRDGIGEALIEVYVNTDETLCRKRRPNASFDGFEPPKNANVTVALDNMTLDEAIQLILAAI